MKAQGRTLTGDVEPGAGQFFRSDHFPLAKAGVPAVSISDPEHYIGKDPAFAKKQRDDYTNNHYHQPSDEYSDSWDLTGAISDLKALATLGWQVAAAPKMPHYNPRRAVRRASSREVTRQDHAHGQPRQPRRHPRCPRAARGHCPPDAGAPGVERSRLAPPAGQVREPAGDGCVQASRRLQPDLAARPRCPCSRRCHVLVGQPRPGRRLGGRAVFDPGHRRHADDGACSEGRRHASLWRRGAVCRHDVAAQDGGRRATAARARPDDGAAVRRCTNHCRAGDRGTGAAGAGARRDDRLRADGRWRTGVRRGRGDQGDRAARADGRRRAGRRGEDDRVACRGPSSHPRCTRRRWPTDCLPCVPAT